MKRRKFLNMGIVAVTAAVVPASLSAVNFREAKPDMWKAEKSSQAIKEMFGEEVFSGQDKLIAVTDKIKMVAPKLAENGGSIPITIKSDLDIETLAFFQDANPRAATIVFSVPEGQKVNYSFRIKMRQTAFVTVVAKTRSGKLHTLNKEIDVSIGGCGG